MTLPATIPQLVLPTTGEVIDLADVPAVVGGLAELRQAGRDIHEVRRVLEGVLVDESRRLGTKTLHADGRKAVVTGGPETVYDVTILAELLENGLPQERYAEVVRTTVEEKPVAGELKRLSAANPVYAEIIGRARMVVEKPWRVNV